MKLLRVCWGLVFAILLSGGALAGGFEVGPDRMGPPHVSNENSNASGVWTGTVDPAYKCWVTPLTAGEFAFSISQNGSTRTITFKKFKAGGLGITLGTLLTVTAFEDAPGLVNFDMFCAQPAP